MVTQQLTKEEIDNKLDRIESLKIALQYPFIQFNDCVSKASVTVNISAMFLDKADKALLDIEDIIKRYRENKLQNFEVKN